MKCLFQMLDVATGKSIFFQYDSILRSNVAMTMVKVHFSKQILWKDALVSYIHKFSPLNSRLDLAPLQSLAAGLHFKWETQAIQTLKEKYIPRNFTSSNAEEVKDPDTPLTLEMLTLAFIFWSTGLLICMALVFPLEKLSVKKTSYIVQYTIPIHCL